MNKFELFSLIYFVLDAEWDETHEKSLGAFLGTMNPFLWEEETSADNRVYESFEKYIGNKDITLENSFNIAKEYIALFSNTNLIKAFSWIDKEKWIEGAKEYLSQDHKGGVKSII